MVAPAVEMHAVHVEEDRVACRVVEREVVHEEIGRAAEGEAVGRRVSDRQAPDGHPLHVREAHRHAEEEAVLVLRRQAARARRRAVPELLGVRRLVEVRHVPDAARERDAAVASADVAPVLDHRAVRPRREADDREAVEPQLGVRADAERLRDAVVPLRRRQVDAGRAGIEPRLDCRRVVRHPVADERRQASPRRQRLQHRRASRDENTSCLGEQRPAPRHCRQCDVPLANPDVRIPRIRPFP